MGLDHIHDAFSTPRLFLEAAARITGRPWVFLGPLCTCQWYGHREVWLLVDQGPMKPVLPLTALKNIFPRLLGRTGSTMTTPANVQPSGLTAKYAPIPVRSKFGPGASSDSHDSGTASFDRESIAPGGYWGCTIGCTNSAHSCSCAASPEHVACRGRAARNTSDEVILRFSAVSPALKSWKHILSVLPS